MRSGMDMRRDVAFVLLLASAAVARAAPVPFSVTGLFGREPVTVDVEWDGGWFGGFPSSEYHHGIARAACLLSDVAYTDVQGNPDGNALRADYRMLGVAEEDMEFHYDVDYGDTLWGNDQCAFSLASVSLPPASGAGRTLVMVVVRGTPLGANEWLSNLNLNDSERTQTRIHEGFSRAATQVHSALISYLFRHKLDPDNLCLLVTGHSRGAAVANLLGAMLRDDGFFIMDNVYVYTFAAPNVTTEEDDGGHGYIWNIINAEDIVPTVPLYHKAWRYRKYGTCLTLVNAYNCDPDRYGQDVLPRMDVYFIQLSGRSYCPFRTGPFLPVVVTTVLGSMNDSVEHFYSGVGALHNKGARLLPLVFRERDGKKASMLGAFLGWLDGKSGGKVQYIENALMDMHANETYLSAMLALEADEAFSGMGYSQIVLDSRVECAVLDAGGNMLARVMDGVVRYSDLRLPIAAITLPFGMGTVISVPANGEFRFVLAEESLAPTRIPLTVNRYDGNGVFVDAVPVQGLSARRGTACAFAAGQATLDAVPVRPERLEGQAAREARSQLRQEWAPGFSFENHLDSALTLGFGFRIGSRNAYGVAVNGLALGHSGRLFQAGMGAGTEQCIAGPLSIAAELMAKGVWGVNLASVEGREVSLLPQLRSLVLLRVAGNVHLFAGGALDMHIEGRNDAAFEADALVRSLPRWRLGGNVELVPTLQVGLRF